MPEADYTPRPVGHPSSLRGLRLRGLDSLLPGWSRDGGTGVCGRLSEYSHILGDDGSECNATIRDFLVAPCAWACIFAACELPMTPANCFLILKQAGWPTWWRR